MTENYNEGGGEGVKQNKIMSKLNCIACGVRGCDGKAGCEYFDSTHKPVANMEKIIQISVSSKSVGEGGEHHTPRVFGLGDKGTVYIYRDGFYDTHTLRKDSGAMDETFSIGWEALKMEERRKL